MKMKSNMYAITGALLLGLLIACSKAQAGCNVTNISPARLTIPDILVGRDVQVGDILWMETTPFNGTQVNCTSEENDSRQNSIGSSSGMTMGNAQIWSLLGAGGIGYAISYDGDGTPFTGKVWPNTYRVNGTIDIAGTKTTMAIVVTGEVTSGQLPAGRYGLWTAGGSTPYVIIREITLTRPVQITKLPCEITTPSIQVPLEDVQGSELTAIGTVLKPQTFNVGLECDAGANISVEMNGIPNTDTSAEGVLQLTNAGSAGMATGVGIQILYMNAPIPFNTALQLKQSAGGQESFPFVAQYYQTKNPVTPGEANATMTLNMTYQ